MSKTVREHLKEVREAYTNYKEVLLWAYWDKNWVEGVTNSQLTDDEWSDVCDHDFDWSDINAQLEAVISDIVSNREPEPDDTKLWEE